ncbi:MAG: hypothetical protein AB7J28_09670 [Hyphomonadaceae bacterium]
MRAYVIAAALAATLILAAPAPAQEGACEALAASLEEGCAPASCTQPHPLMRNFTIEHRVTGEESGACAYAQTMPGNMTMQCRFSAEGRAELAAQLREAAQSQSFSFSTRDPEAENYLTRECEIRDQAGRVIPWGTSEAR